MDATCHAQQALAPLAEAVAASSTGRQNWLRSPVHAEFVGAQEMHTRISPPEAVDLNEGRAACLRRKATMPAPARQLQEPLPTSSVSRFIPSRSHGVRLPLLPLLGLLRLRADCEDYYYYDD